jgi:SAM-dependent methyltransferase
MSEIRRWSEGVRVVADVGAGTGRFLRRVAASEAFPGARLVALDISADMLLTHGRPGPINQPVMADATFLPMRDSSIDRVIGRQILHYVDAHAAAREIARVLSPSGIFHSTQQVDYDEVPDDWYQRWSQLRDVPTRRRLSNGGLNLATEAAGLAELSRRDVLVRLEYTWGELAQKYGITDNTARIRAFFDDSPDSIKACFNMHIDDTLVCYTSSFRVSAFAPSAQRRRLKP